MNDPIHMVELTDADGRPLIVNPTAVAAVGASDGTGGGTTIVLIGGAGAMVAESPDEVLSRLGISVQRRNRDDEPEPEEGE